MIDKLAEDRGRQRRDIGARAILERPDCGLELVSINDLHRRVARYEELRGRLEAARKEASHAQTWGALERVVARVERALLQEVFEWHSLTSLSEAH